MFVDEVEILIEAGRGGNGSASFRHEKYAARGGPDGGDGGDGGSVIIRAREGVDALTALAHRKHWKAKNGEPGRGAQCYGAAAEDLVIDVPPGTLVFDAREGFLLKDLVQPGDEIVAARGGKGGKGNIHFKSSTNRAPRQFTPGGEGQSRRIRLELKLIADVGLLGKPNAGKSTLLSRVSRARPEIAAYPFTTKVPNLGLVQIDSDRSFLMADIPGLIEGAHAGAGLGHEFLRHIQRAGILVHLVEPAPMDGSDPMANYRAIRDELGRYDAKLAERPEIVAITKADLPEAAIIRQRMADELKRPVVLLSAVTGQGLNSLLAEVVRTLDEQKVNSAQDTKLG